MTILDQYITTAPSLQSLLDLFKDEWSSKLPEPLEDLQAGSAQLFQDARIDWLAEQIGGFNRKAVLELGPLEAGHSYMMQQKGAESILAVEANSRAYLKCLIIKEMLKLDRVRFLYGDFIEFLKGSEARFDLCVASGVLYHMRNPAELIELIAQTADQVFIWTHYYDEALLRAHPTMSHRIAPAQAAVQSGFHHMLHRQEYGASLGWNGFCGGSAPYSHWMSRADIISCCEHFGFSSIQLCFDDTDHPNGPSLALLATKPTAQPPAPAQPVASQSVPFLELTALKQQLKSISAENSQLKASLSACSSRIKAMETSKFWQLRKSWFALKQKVGIPSNE